MINELLEHILGTLPLCHASAMQRDVVFETEQRSKICQNNRSWGDDSSRRGQ